MYLYMKNANSFCLYSVLGIRMDLPAPMADRPYFEFSSSSERTKKRVVWGAGTGPARLSHVVYQKKLAIGEYRGILINLDAVVHS